MFCGILRVVVLSGSLALGVGCLPTPNLSGTTDEDAAGSDDDTAGEDGSGTVGTESRCPGVPAPVVYWPMDDVDGSARVLNAMETDAKPFARVQPGAKLTDDPAVIGKAATFSRADDSYMTVAHHERLALEQGTVAFWFRAGPETGSLEGLVGRDEFDTNEDDLSFWLGRQRKVNFRLQPAGGSTMTATSNPVVENRWYHVAGTFGTSPALYLDAMLIQRLGSGGTMAENTHSLIIGADRRSSEPDQPPRHFFGGQIDEVAIFDVHLSEEQIATLAGGDCQLFRSE